METFITACGYMGIVPRNLPTHASPFPVSHEPETSGATGELSQTRSEPLVSDECESERAGFVT
jgi:hypothetical protein